MLYEVITIGGVIAKLTPTHNYEVVAILGMVSFLTGVVQAPITSFVIVMEMTDNHDIRITSYNVCYTKLLRIWSYCTNSEK